MQIFKKLSFPEQAPDFHPCIRQPVVCLRVSVPKGSSCAWRWLVLVRSGGWWRQQGKVPQIHKFPDEICWLNCHISSRAIFILKFPDSYFLFPNLTFCSLVPTCIQYISLYCTGTQFEISRTCAVGHILKLTDFPWTETRGKSLIEPWTATDLCLQAFHSWSTQYREHFAPCNSSWICKFSKESFSARLADMNSDLQCTVSHFKARKPQSLVDACNAPRWGPVMLLWSLLRYG